MIKAWGKYTIKAGAGGLIAIVVGVVFPPLILVGLLAWLSIPFFPILRLGMKDFFVKRGF